MKKTLLTAIYTLLVTASINANAFEQTYNGSGVDLNEAGEVIESYEMSVKISAINELQEIQIITKSFEDGKTKVNECLVTKEQQTKSQLKVTRDCHNGFGELLCIGHLCNGEFESIWGNVSDVSSVKDGKLYRRYSTYTNRAGEVINTRQILKKQPLLPKK